MSQPTWTPSTTKACSANQGGEITRLIGALRTYAPEFYDGWREDLRNRYRAHDFSRADASVAITALRDELERLRTEAEPQVSAAFDPCVVFDGPAVPQGYYAVATDEGAVNALAFYRVSAIDERSVIVAHQLSGELHDLPRAQAETVLAKIAINPKEAAATYGRELGFCGRCHRPLTNDESRAQGLGPVCSGKY